MTYKELNDALERVDQVAFNLERMYMENEGEVTEETQNLEAVYNDLKELIAGQGLDLLGGWLKAKEDRKEALKTERAYINSQIEAIDDTIDFIKDRVCLVMRRCNLEKTEKSTRGYSFARFNAVKTEVDKEELNAAYKDEVEAVLRDNGIIPDDVTITLGASVSMLDDDCAELPAYYKRTITPSVRFNKPRIKK